MSRFEGKFSAADAAPLDAAELVEALEAQLQLSARERKHAIACYLSGGEGWRAALERLDGTFAGSGRKTGLSGDKGS